MAADVFVQVALLILTLATFIAIQYLPKQALTKHRTSNRTTIQTNRHLEQASNLLARARTTSHRAQALTQAKSALAEAEKALSLSPKHPKPHIIKALSLDLLGHRTSALRSLDLALSPPRVKSLLATEREEALLKRAKLKMGVNRRRRVDSAVADLEEAVGLSEGGNSTALSLLGECYEVKGMREKAKWAYEEALRLEPDSDSAREGLDRL